LTSDVRQVKAAEMSAKAETRGPVTRRRRTTISNGSKWTDAGEKPTQPPAKDNAAEASKHAGNNGKVVVGEMEQRRLPDSPKKQKSVVEDFNERLR